MKEMRSEDRPRDGNFEGTYSVDVITPLEEAIQVQFEDTIGRYTQAKKPQVDKINSSTTQDDVQQYRIIHT
jgi:hypothetical protein